MIEEIAKEDKKQEKILPCSVLLEGEYGLNDVFIGVPVKLGKEGIKEIVELELSKEENELLKKSAENIKNNIKKL